jgi:hypothetical protein
LIRPRHLADRPRTSPVSSVPAGYFKACSDAGQTADGGSAQAYTSDWVNSTADEGLLPVLAFSLKLSMMLLIVCAKAVKRHRLTRMPGHRILVAMGIMGST